MDSNERWLPASWNIARSLCALGAIVAAVLSAPSAVGDESLHSFGRPSTLDTYVPVQDLDLQATVSDIVDRGMRSEPPQRSRKAPVPAPLSKTERATRRPSPFRKWIAPQSDSSGAATSTERKPSTARTPAAAPSTAPPKSKEAPQASSAKRPTTSSPPPPKVAKPLPATGKRVARATAPEAAPPTEYPKPKLNDPSQSAVSSSSALPPLSRSQQNLRAKIRRVLTLYYNRPLNTKNRSPWELMHAMLAYEVHSKVLRGGPRGEPVTAVGWLCFNQTCKRRTLMYINDDDKMRVRVGPALQGHRGQLLAMLAQCKVSREYPMRIDDQDFTIADLINMEMETCYPRTELTFKLIGLMHYLDSDAKWMNDQGMQWNIPRLISEELRQPVRGAACGGTHRLSGLTLAYKTRIKRGEPVDGQYLQAQRFVRRYQQYAYRLQNPDGSFSTEWFRGRGNEESLDRKLKTTGHLLEWLLYAATEKELKSWRTTKAANYLANIMIGNRYKDWEAGPLGHAIHALLVYDRMVFSPYDEAGGMLDVLQAKSPSRARRQR